MLVFLVVILVVANETRWSLCVLVGPPGVTDVLVSSLSVGFLGEHLLSGSDGEFVESQSFSFPRKRQAFLID